jgi:hypothetical protein
MQYHKLIELLYQTWDSPVFTDSYPSLTAEQASRVLEQIEQTHTQFVTTLEPLLRQGMPEAKCSDVANIMQQIASKSTAFCAAIAAGEVDDIERLCDAALSIALVYWADQSMDRGDEAMLAAVYALPKNGSTPGWQKPALPPLAAARFKTLQAIETAISRLSRPEDASVLLPAVFDDTLKQEARIWELSQYYLRANKEQFWVNHAAEVAYLSINNGALIYVTAAIYAIFRYHRPTLPPLSEIFQNRQVMDLMEGPCNAAIRVYDDWGDRHIDSGAYPQWGGFYLNIFNQANPLFLNDFLRYAHVSDPWDVFFLINAFQTDEEENHQYILDFFANLLRQRMAGLPASVWQRYGPFLKLAKRVLEAGYVNTMGDMNLAEDHLLPVCKAQ